MRKIYLLLAAIFGSLLLKAQTTDNVNFNFAPDPLTNNVAFTNTTVLHGDAPRKAFWSFGDGSTQVTTPLANTSHHYSAPGTYTVCLKIYRYFTNPNDSVLTGQECKQVTLQQVCSAGFEWNDSISQNPLLHNVNFHGHGTNTSNNPIIQVCWNFGDGHDTCINITTAATPSLYIHHRYLQSGTYTACIKIKYDGGCIAEKCNVVVLIAPTIADSCRANYEVASISATPLGRKFIALPWHSNGKKPVRICWTFGDGKDTCIEYTTAFTGQYFAEHIYAAAGQYSVCVKIKYDGGCEKQKCEMLLIQVPPPADNCSFTLNEAATNVSNLERKFYIGLMENRRAEKICWNFGDGTDTCVNLANPLNSQQLLITHHYPAPGNYTVCAKVFYVGCIVQRCRPVSITVPNSHICGGYLSDSAISPTTIRFKGTGIQDAPDYVLSYNWTFGDGTTASGQQATHTYLTAGNYQACLYIKTAGGCETRICKPLRIAGTAVQQLVLSPNPVVNTLHTLFISARTENVAVKIFNANGLLVRSYTRFAVTGANNWDFDLATLPAGVYSVVVQSAYQFATAIFFKQ